jgi:hypothetical protein
MPLIAGARAYKPEEKTDTLTLCSLADQCRQLAQKIRRDPSITSSMARSQIKVLHYAAEDFERLDLIQKRKLK